MMCFYTLILKCRVLLATASKSRFAVHLLTSLTCTFNVVHVHRRTLITWHTNLHGPERVVVRWLFKVTVVGSDVGTCQRNLRCLGMCEAQWRHRMHLHRVISLALTTMMLMMASCLSDMKLLVPERLDVYHRRATGRETQYIRTVLLGMLDLDWFVRFHTCSPASSASSLIARSSAALSITIIRTI